FAVHEAAGGALAEWIGHLGFREAGRHRSKSVSLYRQGRVNLVLNAEEDSAAAEHFQLHGPSVCAMALRVDDAERAIARAEALLCPRWQEKTGPGERVIPSIRAPDGTLIFLMEPSADGRTIYDDDFVLSGAPDAPGGIATIDHVAHALPHGRMDGTVLFWRAVFGFTPEALVELPDPYGLIRSRAMVSPDGSIRLPLNISESRETQTGRFVSAYAGAGVHHIAFGAPDIVAAVQSISAQGARILPIPANYYDDLAARWPLDDEELERLRALNLLYDQDEGGTFRHAYTDNFHDRFFFEIVERHGYRGFGAVNAPVRMAAQAQRRGSGDLAARMALL
ncbi:MAG: VOC family protein, partial [Proteobacteria bacterium]|nr:VOC family protein [Pseudomonadota bacterium]